MQKNIERKTLKKLKAITLSSEIDTLLMFLKSKSFWSHNLMGIIYIPNILKHWFTDSLYDSPNIQMLWHVIDSIYFSNFSTSIAKQTPAMIPMMGKEAVFTQFAFLPIWNFVVNFTILKSSSVFANHLRYLNANFISSSI